MMTLLEVLFWIVLNSLLWAAAAWYCYTIGWYKGRAHGINLTNKVWTKDLERQERVAADRQKFGHLS